MTSSNQAVAQIEGNTIVFVGAGKTTIKITSTVGTKASTVSRNITVQSKVSGISISNAEVTVARKGKVTLIANTSPFDATNKNITWATSDKKIATVTNKGVVTGVAGGRCMITVTTKDGNFKATAFVNVTPIYETGIKLNKSSASLAKGKILALKATFIPPTTDFKTVTWTSSNTAVATIDAKGVVKAVNTGTCTITATSANGVKATCIITTLPQLVRSVKFGPVNANQSAGAIVKIPFTVAPATADNTSITWSSNAPSVATVAADGTVTFHAGGKVTITATSADGSRKTAKRAFTVKQPVSNISLYTGAATTEKGKTVALFANVTPATASNRAVTWTTSNNKIATVSSAGVVKGVAPGTVTITCTAKDGNGAVARCTVTVQ